MSKVEYQHAEDLRLTFCELAAAGILDDNDEDQPLFYIVQKLLKSEKSIQTQLKSVHFSHLSKNINRKLGKEKNQLKLDIISNDTHSQKQQQLPLINCEKKDDTRKYKDEDPSCSVCSEKERKIRSICPKCSERKNSKEGNPKTLKENEEIQPMKLSTQDSKPKRTFGFFF